MSIMDYGDRLCTIEDGKEVEIQPYSFAIDGERVFDYDIESGLLKLNRGRLPVLEKIMASISGEIPSEGIDVQIPIPLRRPAILAGVKQIEYMSAEEIVMEDKPTPTPKTSLFQKILNYLRR